MQLGEGSSCESIWMGREGQAYGWVDIRNIGRFVFESQSARHNS